jgi:hypothetical protein
MAKTFLFVLTGLLLLASSCKTYTIPVDDFRQQYGGLGHSHSRRVTVQGPGGKGDTVSYYTYPIYSLKCFDKDGNPYRLTTSPSIEIRFTYGDHNKRAIFYFDLLTITDSTIGGIQSRFIPTIKKTIPLNAVTKIEVQDGRKKFKYVEN